MNNLKYSEILRLNKELESNTQRSLYTIALLSNVVVHQGKEIIEYLLRDTGINANIELGDYDNVVQDSQKQGKSDATIIFWELANLVDGLQYKIELLTDDEIEAIEQKTKSEIGFTIKHLENSPLILINKFSSFFFSSSVIDDRKLDGLVDRLNKFLETISQSNIKLISLDKIIAGVGVSNSFDPRYYYSSKAPYTVTFFKAYAQFIKPFIMSANGMAKKALIFDCDNTLWKGILGEDGVRGIELSPSTKNGAIFQEIQSIALSLIQQGVIIGLCSKNNPEDVDEMLTNHPDMVLQDKHITIKAVNWSDKVTNLKNISKELNIGLDSMVFVDDSQFEVSLIKKQLPEVTVLQVPEKLYEYSQMIRSSLGLFYNLAHSVEDSIKTKIYREQKQRDQVKSEFSTMDEYLSSLELKVAIFKNDESLISRMSQMTQKTNQFNLTTKRYTEIEIESMVLSLKTDVYAFSVEDKFGDGGVTGLCIVNFDDDVAVIDSFLMSCRVIGRNIEYVFMDHIVTSLIKSNIVNIKSKFIKTMKNMQVEEFFKSCSFQLENEEGSVKNYNLTVNKYKKNEIEYIEVESHEQWRRK
jgi:FkbH-like protein